MEVYENHVEEAVNEFSSCSDDERSPSMRRNKNGRRYVMKLKFQRSERKACDDNDSSRRYESPELAVGFLSSQKGTDGGITANDCDKKEYTQLKNQRNNVAPQRGDDHSMHVQRQLLIDKSTDRFICSVCSKNFTSMKSLSGHMRCHPERNWRGIQPPSVAKNISLSSTVSESAGRGKHDDQLESTTSTESSASDCLQSLSSWPLTAKRCRSATFQVAASEFPEVDEGVSATMADAVQNLLMLSQGDPLELGSSKENKKKPRVEEEFGAENRDFVSNKSGIQVSRGDGYSPKSMNMNMDLKLENRDGLDDDDSKQKSEESESNNTNYNRQAMQLNYGLNIVKKTIKRKRKMKALEMVPDDRRLVDYKKKPTAAAAATARRYHCSICDKTFSSHQALGGHKASHKKGKYESMVGDSIDDDHETIVAPAHSNASPVSEDQRPKPAASASVHRCKICYKSFPSGQALGGHQRCHWGGPAEQPPASSVTSAENIETKVGRHSVSQGNETKEVRRRLLDFDLNELPPPTIPDDDQEYASSLHNSVVG